MFKIGDNVKFYNLPNLEGTITGIPDKVRDDDIQKYFVGNGLFLETEIYIN